MPTGEPFCLVVSREGISEIVNGWNGSMVSERPLMVATILGATWVKFLLVGSIHDSIRYRLLMFK